MIDIKFFKKNKASFDALHSRVQEACFSNNIKDIQEILSTNCYPKLSQEDKEKHLFWSVSVAIFYSQCGYDIMNYLILDYDIQVKEDASTLMIRTQETRDLLEQRKLQKEVKKEFNHLNKNLTVNDIPSANKKPKI